VQKGLTLVPLKLYIKHGVAKLELGVAKGKKAYDKREAIARRDAEREVERALKYRRR
jgi:SsrA-binding protein